MGPGDPTGSDLIGGRTPYVFSVMHRLIALAAFFRQHSLAFRRVLGDARHAGLKRISLRPGRCTAAAFPDGGPGHG